MLTGYGSEAKRLALQLHEKTLVAGYYQVDLRLAPSRSVGSSDHVLVDID
jgi:hypothetical protein